MIQKRGLAHVILVACLPLLIAMLTFLAFMSPYRLGLAMVRTGSNIMQLFADDLGE